MKKFLAVAGAVALAVVWTAGPALADDLKDKAETTKDKAAAKTESTADKAESTMKKAAETVKEKAHEAKVKIEEKVNHAKAKTESANRTAEVRSTQQALKDKGFDPGPIDGKMGPRTAAALRDYQKAEKLSATGRMDEQTMASLGVSPTPSASPSTSATSPATQQQAGK